MRTRLIRLRGFAVAVVVAASGSSISYPLVAQQPQSTSPIQVAPYRPPVIALVQPVNGGTVPQDRPIVVLRFAAGEPGDPLDMSGLRVSVDGVDATSRFQLTATEAWGSIGSPSGAASEAEPIAPGAHQVVARICSSRGTCAETTALITVVPTAVSSTVADKATDRRRERVLDALIAAVKKLLTP